VTEGVPVADVVDGTSFGRYRLTGLLGEGGMGEVWQAHDTVTDRVVAIKVLSAKLSNDEEFQRRFRREAHAAARLETPHVVPIHDYGEIGGRLFVCIRVSFGSSETGRPPTTPSPIRLSLGRRS
jgi:serine/threonine protein kinase